MPDSPLPQRDLVPLVTEAGRLGFPLQKENGGGCGLYLGHLVLDESGPFAVYCSRITRHSGECAASSGSLVLRRE